MKVSRCEGVTLVQALCWCRLHAGAGFTLVQASRWCRCHAGAGVTLVKRNYGFCGPSLLGDAPASREVNRATND